MSNGPWDTPISQSPYIKPASSQDFAGSLSYSGDNVQAQQGTDWAGLMSKFAGDGKQTQQQQDTPEARHRAWRQIYFQKLAERKRSMGIP